MISPKNYMSNTVTVDFSVTDNALVRGYYYDKTTGVRYNKTYNVSGNNSLKAENVFNLQFGRRKQFTLSSATVLAIYIVWIWWVLTEWSRLRQRWIHVL